jgi:hypothetical protein
VQFDPPAAYPSEVEVRQTAVQWRAQLARADAGGRVQAIHYLAERLARRNENTSAGGAGKNALSLASTAVHDPLPSLRSLAAAAIARSQSPLAVSILPACLVDPSTEVQLETPKAVARLEDRGAAAAILRQAFVAVPPMPVQAAIVRAFGELGEDTLDWMFDQLSKDEEAPADLRVAALEAAVRIGLDARATALAWIETDDPVLRRGGVAALALLAPNDPAAAARLEELTRTPSFSLQVTSIAALARVSPAVVEALWDAPAFSWLHETDLAAARSLGSEEGRSH